MVVIFHYQDSTHIYYFHFAAKSDEKHNIMAIVNGKDREKINHKAGDAHKSILTDREFQELSQL